MYAIIGSGFGLYGYLPALIELGNRKILLHEKYQKIFNQRDDIAKYYNFIQWKKSHRDCIDECENLILATTPRKQFEIITSINRNEKLEKIFLEKPISHSIEKSRYLLNYLQESNIDYDVNYSFLFLGWFTVLEKFIKNNPDSEITINWNFNSYHVKNKIQETWKNQSNEGGGIINFYGIHLIAILAMIEDINPVYSKTVITSNNFYTEWHSIFSSGKTKVNLFVKCNSNNNVFSIKTESSNKKSVLFNDDSPFNTNVINDKLDYRINTLKLFLLSKPNLFCFHEKVIMLWESILEINNS